MVNSRIYELDSREIQIKTTAARRFLHDETGMIVIGVGEPESLEGVGYCCGLAPCGAEEVGDDHVAVRLLSGMEPGRLCFATHMVPMKDVVVVLATN